MISKDITIYELVNTYPKALDILVSKGFNQLTNKVMFNTAAKFTTLEKVCKMKSVDMEALISEILKA
jgi:hypothetical protein